jgi:hypothetical protein
MVGLWGAFAAGFLANIAAASLVVVLYIVVQWFLGATDITIGYVWRFDGTPDNPRNLRPGFDIRNRSRTRTYFLANAGYFKGSTPVAPFDNKSVWGTELKPGTIMFLEAAPVQGITSLDQCVGIEVHIRLQNGRSFWLKGVGLGQLRMGRIQRFAFWLRNKFEKAAVPLE